MIDIDTACAACGTGAIVLAQEFETIPRVTSDCRPFPSGGRIGICRDCHTVQKPADAAWQRDAAEIYSRYDIFRQALQHSEQRIFNQTSQTSLKRSEAVLTRLAGAEPFPDTGRALDVGCGNGPTLRALAAIAPNWKLYGHEISDANAELLRKIPQFQKLYTGDPANIRERFDLIVLSHSLEHIPSPVEALGQLRSNLAPGGRLLVEVPNTRSNIYDLIVADHRSHFDSATLAEVARRAGFVYSAVFDDWIFKELTLLASDSPLPSLSSTPPPAPLRVDDLAQRVAWLDSLLKMADDAARTAKPFGIFGTAIAATWVLGRIQDHVDFFVDEDEARIGQTHEGRVILAPDQVPPESTVFIPLVPSVASAVAKRLQANGVKTVVPSEQVFDRL